MADRKFLPPLGALEVDVVDLFCTIPIGASGAVGTVVGKGVTSVTRNSAGKYTILLSDRYNSFLWGDVSTLDDTNSDATTVGIHTRLFSEAVNNATPTVIIQAVAGDDGAAADPANGATLYVHFKLRNSSVS